MKKLEVNENCIRCGACIAIAGDLFETASNGMSKPNEKVKITSANIGLANDAVDSCPVGAISIVEENDIVSSEVPNNNGNNKNDEVTNGN